MPYIGINEQDKEQMLKEIQASSIEDLFVDIPEKLLFKRELNLEEGYSEWELIKYFNKLAEKNAYIMHSFKGAGCYHHHVPSLVKSLSGRGEFLTAYTPYQAEASQGTLETIYMFQSFIAELTGMETCNASMYDGATALAESITMSYRLNKKRPIFLSKNIHPQYLEVTQNYLDCLEIKYEMFDSLDSVPEGAAVAIQNPSFHGELVNTDLVKNIVSSKDLFLIAVITEPYALASIAKPSDWGAQIICGSAQSFGNPPHYGGAQVGFIATISKNIRQIPGRVVGKTTDRNGKEGFVLTFQAREQHIKRERAGSNICTNQSIHALCSAIYLSLLGEKGLKKVAKEIWSKTSALMQSLAVFANIEVKSKNVFNEFLVEIDASGDIHEQLHDLFSLFAVSLGDNLFLLNVSEMHNLEELNSFVEKIAKIVEVKAPLISSEQLKKLGKEYDKKESPTINIPNKSELEVCRYYTKLSQKNFSIDTNFYPLGSCTMKYNPKVNDEIASNPAWTEMNPYVADENAQGALEIIDELNKSLCEITGFHRFSLQPSAGAHGEFTALLMAKKYFADNGQSDRNIVFVPDSAHGTNPASATMAGFKTFSIKTKGNGNVDIDDLKAAIAKHQEHVGVFMLTNPSTLGLFEQNILEITQAIHSAGGLMYYDGANLNAIAGIARPGDMGFDLLHLNLHKSFSTPHGGGGPGAGPIGACEKLAPYLPSPCLARDPEGKLHWERRSEKSIGRIRSFYGNFNVLIRALAYIKRNGKEGIKRIGETATLNANYLQAKVKHNDLLAKDGIFTPAFDRVCKHEFIISAAKLKEKYGITALDVAKRLLDKGIHAPTIYFPISIPEAIMIEPTETESKAALDTLIVAFEEIIQEAENEESREQLKLAPLTFEFSRFDEVKAVKEPILSTVMEKKLSEAKASA